MRWMKNVGLILLILCIFLIPLHIQPRHVLAVQMPLIRVLLAEGLESIKVSGDLEITGFKEPVILNGEKVFKKTDVSAVLSIKAQAGFVNVNGQAYRGDILVKPKPDGISVINLVDLESYLQGVVPGEISADWPLEALKAQAVAARCYAIFQSKARANQEFDVYNDLRSQMYVGVSKEKTRTNQAVQDTTGLVAVFNGEVIQAYFFAAGGGQTARSEDVWGVSIPYLVSVEDYDQNSPYSNWQIIVTISELLSKLKSAGTDIGEFDDLSVERDASNRVLTVKVIGSAGQCTLAGTKFRTLFNLRSTNFTVTLLYPEERAKPVNGKIEPQPDREKEPALFSRQPIALSIAGQGYGHGVGLSQWGAREMALKGYTFKDIIKHYYPGTEVVKLY